MSIGPEPSRAGTSSTARSLFISYRRDDAAGWAGRLQADLRSRLGPGVQVFMDIDGIPAGEDFARAIDSAVGRCDVLVALIGPGWIDAIDPDGRRRLEDPNDFVRIEVEAALRRNIRVIPALVGGVHLPRQDALPEPLRQLTRRQAVKLDNETWDLGLSRLVKAIEPAPGNAPPRLRLSTDRVDFGVLDLREQPRRRTVRISNEGEGELNAVVTTTDAWIVVQNHNDAIDVLVDTSNPGEHVGRVTVSSAGGTSSIVVTATVNAESPPQSCPSTLNSRWHPGRRMLAGVLALGMTATLTLVVVLLLRSQEFSRTPEVTPSVYNPASGSAPTPHSRGDSGNLPAHQQAPSAASPSDTGSPGSLRNPYATGRNCGDGVYAGPNTSCPFAFNVRQAWQQAGGTTNSVTAYSPTTGLTYRMTCAPAGSAITCSGGKNASVTFRY